MSSVLAMATEVILARLRTGQLAPAVSTRRQWRIRQQRPWEKAHTYRKTQARRGRSTHAPPHASPGSVPHPRGDHKAGSAPPGSCREPVCPTHPPAHETS
jgi:hypothetical protein